MKVVFRTDASFEIGTGHVMRCVTLAEKLKTKGFHCQFICREYPGHLIPFILGKGFQVFSLPLEQIYQNDSLISLGAKISESNEWVGNDWLYDAQQSIIALEQITPDWLVVDHYVLGLKWEEQLRPHVQKIMVIDDFTNREHDCDLLLNQNFVQNGESRYRQLVQKDAIKLIGPSWALLHPDYADLHNRMPARISPVKKIFVYFGGADLKNITGVVLEVLIKMNKSDVVIDVVIHPDWVHEASLIEMVRPFPNIIVHKNLKSLAFLIAEADLAIGACGSTSWERCCLGLPSLVITIADNQVPIATQLEKLGCIWLLGDHLNLSVERLEKVLHEILNDRIGEIEKFSKRCLSIVDGKGAARVSELMHFEHSFTPEIKMARISDEKYLLPWFTRSEFYSILRQPLKIVLMVARSPEGNFLGWVAFRNVKSDSWMMLYNSLDLGYLNKRIRRKILHTGLKNFKSKKPGSLNLISTPSYFSSPLSHILDKADSMFLKGSLAVTICSDKKSWFNQYIPELILEWLGIGHRCSWVHDSNDISEGDICFYLSYGSIVHSQILGKFKNNLVVHGSDLPSGKGWSPLTWQVLEGQRKFPVTLIEAEEKVDSGRIYYQEWFDSDGTELISELRDKQADVTIKLCQKFIANYPEIRRFGKKQSGEESYYQKRSKKDSELNPRKSIENQFNLLRVVDNERYPAFFRINGCEYSLQIKKIKIKTNKPLPKKL